MEEEFDSTEHSGLFAEFYDILHAGNQDISGYLELADAAVKGMKACFL